MAEHSAAWSPKEMQAQYGGFYKEGVFLVLDDTKIPEFVRPIKHYAEFWAPLSDTVALETLADEAPPHVARNLIAVVDEVDSHLDEWLAGEEADKRPFSREYLAYTELRMASDYLRAVRSPTEGT